MKDNVIEADRIGDTDYQVEIDLSETDNLNITDKLRKFVEQHETYQHEIDAQKDLQKGVIEMVKANGLHVKAFREVLKRRRQDPDELGECDRSVAVYESLLDGGAGDGRG